METDNTGGGGTETYPGTYSAPDHGIGTEPTNPTDPVPTNPTDPVQII